MRTSLDGFVLTGGRTLRMGRNGDLVARIGCGAPAGWSQAVAMEAATRDKRFRIQEFASSVDA